MHASERSGVRAYRLVSIYARPGVSGPPGRGRRDRPHCPLDEHCALLRPALERPASLFSFLSFYLFACVSVIFSFRTSLDRTGSGKKRGERGGTVTRGISGRANLVTKWLLRVSLAARRSTRWVCIDKSFGKWCARGEFISYRSLPLSFLNGTVNSELFLAVLLMRKK